MSGKDFMFRKKELLVTLILAGGVLGWYLFKIRGASCYEEKLPSESELSTYHYDFLEFCIPKNERFLREVEGVEGTIYLSCEFGSKGRIGCDDEEYLCTLVTSTSRAALCELSKLKYIEKIQGSYAE